MLKLMALDENSSATLNFTGGALAQHVANTVVGECDRQNARQRLLKRKSEGDTCRDRIMRIKKKLTAGKLVLDGGSHHLDRNVLDHVQQKRQEMEAETIAKRRKDDFEYLKLCHAADVVIKNYGDTPIEKWRRRDEIVAVLRPLKRDGDKALPTSRKDTEKRYYEYKD